MPCSKVTGRASSPLINSSITATGCILITLSSTPHQSITTYCPLPHTCLSQHATLHYNILHFTRLDYTTLDYTTLRIAHITSDFSMRIAKLSMRDRAWIFFESSPCKPPRAMDNPLELNTPVVMWKREGEYACL